MGTTEDARELIRTTDWPTFLLQPTTGRMIGRAAGGAVARSELSRHLQAMTGRLGDEQMVLEMASSLGPDLVESKDRS